MKSFVDDLLEEQHISRRRHSGSGREPRGRVSARGKAPAGKNFREGVFQGSFPVGEALRPAGVHIPFEQKSRFIDNIQQNPRRGTRRNYEAPARKTSILREIFGDGEDAGPEPSGRDRGAALRREESGWNPAVKKPSVRRPHYRQPVDRMSTDRMSAIPRGPRAGAGNPFRKAGFSLPGFPVIPFTAFLLLALGVFFVVHSQAGAFDWAGREAVSYGKDQGSGYNLALYAGISPAGAPAEEGESIPLDLTETFAWQGYKVKRGDTVSKIAGVFSVSMDAVIASNGITNARALREGEEIRIPNMDGIPYTVRAGDSLSGISGAMGVPLEAILDANDIQDDAISPGRTLFIPGARMNRDDLKMALGELFVYPLKGARLSSPFGWRNDPISGVRRHHAALDLSAPQGTPVKAAMDGKVSSTGYNGTYGNFIIITHPGGYQTLYAHLHTVAVKAREQVRQGSQIGTVGNTGYSTGPHLHFSVFKNNRAVNPLDLLNPRS